LMTIADVERRAARQALTLGLRLEHLVGSVERHLAQAFREHGSVGGRGVDELPLAASSGRVQELVPASKRPVLIEWPDQRHAGNGDESVEEATFRSDRVPVEVRHTGGTVVRADV